MSRSPVQPIKKVKKLDVFLQLGLAIHDNHRFVRLESSLLSDAAYIPPPFVVAAYQPTAHCVLPTTSMLPPFHPLIPLLSSSSFPFLHRLLFFFYSLSSSSSTVILFSFIFKSLIYTSVSRVGILIPTGIYWSDQTNIPGGRHDIFSSPYNLTIKSGKRSLIPRVQGEFETKHQIFHTKTLTI